MSWKWFGVKSLYREVAHGRPEGKDADYCRDASLVEERIVLVRARSNEEAIRKATTEGSRYAEFGLGRNPYGQQLRNKLVGVVDSYEIEADALESGTELYSSTEVVTGRNPDIALISRMIGHQETPRSRELRRNFRLIVFNRPAPGVRPTKQEVRQRRL